MPEVCIQAEGARLGADLAVPAEALGVVVFAHGSGSSRFSSRNRFVARALQVAGFTTLLMDLLTSEEEKLDLRTGRLRFDISLLAPRVVEAVNWLGANESTAGLAVGCFGASTGAAAALVAAARLPSAVKAVVSRGGRPDLAGEALASVAAPTLLIVGGADQAVIELNEGAMDRLTAIAELRIVQGAGHLFEEPGALEQVAGMAIDWFRRHLPKSSSRA